MHGNIVWGLFLVLILPVLIDQHLRDDHPRYYGIISEGGRSILSEVDRELRVFFDREALMLLHVSHPPQVKEALPIDKQVWVPIDVKGFKPLTH
jgi:hypothetical protein